MTYIYIVIFVPLTVILIRIIIIINRNNNNDNNNIYSVPVAKFQLTGETITSTSMRIAIVTNTK